MGDPAKDAWVGKVLGVKVGTKGQRGVAFTKLLLDWRDAQSRLSGSLSGLAGAILRNEEVRADPRLASVEQAVKGLSQLVPEFGGTLETALDRVINDGNLQGGGKDVLAAVAAYRQRLAGAAALSRLEAIAGEHLQATPLIGPLDAVLAEIERSVAAAL
jgi:hypothetical protein